VQARSVVMAKVITLVHEVHVVINGYGIYKIILGMFLIAEGMLNP
jgi:hypothetical protein